MELIEHNVPIMGLDSTSPSSNANNPTYVFDNRFVFEALDRMMHYKIISMEDSSSVYTWKEKYEIQHIVNMECLKKIGNMEIAIERQIQESRSIIEGKYHIIVGLKSEVSLIIEECKRDIDDARETFKMSLATYTITILNLEDKLKSLPQVLKIYPLNTASNPEVDELKNSLKEKEGLIQNFKDEFENIVIELR